VDPGSTGFEAVIYVTGLSGLIGLPWSSTAIVRWWGRVRSLGRGPWKTGVTSLEEMDWQWTLLWVRFESGEKRSLITTWGGPDVSVKWPVTQAYRWWSAATVPR
jgi:hypothetical protein